MAARVPCLQETSVSFRNGPELACDETNCQFVFLFNMEDSVSSFRSKEATRILDYRLRTGDPMNSNHKPCEKRE